MFGDLIALDEHPAPTPGSFGVGDLDRDGDTDYVRTAGRQAGAYRLDRERARWLGFQPFASLPHLEALGGRAQWIDLNGDGQPTWSSRAGFAAGSPSMAMSSSPRSRSRVPTRGTAPRSVRPTLIRTSTSPT